MEVHGTTSVNGVAEVQLPHLASPKNNPLALNPEPETLKEFGVLPLGHGRYCKQGSRRLS